MSSSLDLSFDDNAAIERLLRLLAVQGVTGQEKAIARAVVGELESVGVPRRAIRHDSADQRIPLPTQTGNLIVNLSGTQVGPRLLFSAHLDTVPLCTGAVPERVRERIVSRGHTALGGDDRTGVACLVTLAATLLQNKLPHPPLTLLFTVREESGLFGARHVDPADLDAPVMAFNVDGRSPSELTIGAVGAERWEVEIHGRASHAGVHPEQGISATMVTALALSEIHRGGWFGKVHQRDGDGTSNVGRVAGRDGHSAGDATNVVTDFVRVHGETRSHDAKFAKAITRAYRAAFTNAAEQVRNDKGRKAKVKFTSRLDYHPFRLKDDTPVVRHAQDAAVRAGLQPSLRIGNGGLDANWLVRHGIPTVTFGAGQNNIH
ncbi:MAG: M20/M25/M40 family metallo-hydrolase, partial [Gemmataceae bacterium]